MDFLPKIVSFKKFGVSIIGVSKQHKNVDKKAICCKFKVIVNYNTGQVVGTDGLHAIVNQSIYSFDGMKNKQIYAFEK